MKTRRIDICLISALAAFFIMSAGCGDGSDAGIGKSEKDIAGPAGSGNAVRGDMLSPGSYIDENGFWAGVKATDHVGEINHKALPDYLFRVSEDDIKAGMLEIVREFSYTEKIYDRAVSFGDTVNIDYVGSTGGVEFVGGSTGGMGTDVTIGVTNYIDDFLEQLIGRMPGETLNVEVTFPVDYHAAELRGADAVFVTTVNYIAEETAPDLTDEFTAENLYAGYGWTTVDEMKEDVRIALIKNAVRQYLSEEVPVASVPEGMIEYQIRSMLDDYREYAEYYDMELDDLLPLIAGISGTEELIELSYAENLARARFSLVVQAFAETENISVSDGDLAEYFLKTSGTSDYSAFEERYGLPFLKHAVLCELVTEYIIENSAPGN
ncbi:MAG: FKBP-type peptidyl-prolyl cis-trans isomerase [Oscillospiraceae bacterium]|nr:FKBP-type peptidyl-prolyl cis-trans isomerase [Oscillospiraceae bacterium]